jgi:tetratricopeptide (TPR) repeat protein
MKKLTFALVITLAIPGLALAQDAAQVRKMFEAGRYRQVVDSAGDASAPAALYTAAQSFQKLGANGEAHSTYGQLAARPEDDPWHFIGLSGQQMLDNDNDGALASAERAVAMGGHIAEAHYQLGLARAKRQEWSEAADAFDRAIEVDPTLAYAYYYGGLMHHRSGRTGQMSVHFERFLTLAPEAPERPEVMQIMRTVRGR